MSTSEKMLIQLYVYTILIAVFILLIAKSFFYSNKESVFFLFFYGMTITSVLFVIFIVTFHWYKDPAIIGETVQKRKKNEPLVSCMVAVRNEEQLISQCIDSFLEQTYPHKEIIVVNDASTDGTKKILDSFREKGVTVIHLKENVGKKRALALAMLHAKGDIFAFTDSDSVLAKDAIAKVIDGFSADPLIGAIAGHCRALNREKNFLTVIQDCWYDGQFSIRKAFESVFGAVTCVSGPLACFRKESIFNFIPAWEKDAFLGQEFRFATDRMLTGFVLGNEAMGEKIKKKYAGSPFLQKDYPLKNWKVVYCKSARAFTKVPETFSSFIKQQIRWKKSFIRNIFFTGSFYWRKPFLPALFYYLHLLFVFAGPFIAFRYLIYLPLQGAYFSAVLYLVGIVFVGFMFGLAYKVENKQSHHWIYRPFMSLMSTLLLTWLIFYALLTLRRSTWHRG